MQQAAVEVRDVAPSVDPPSPHALKCVLLDCNALHCDYVTGLLVY